ncbi:hypothetical protein GCM10020254_31130 [Streptomyces goshikiensis]
MEWGCPVAKADNKAMAGGATRLVSHLARALREKENLTQKALGGEAGVHGVRDQCDGDLRAAPPSDEMLVKLEETIGAGLGVFQEAREWVRLEKFPPYFQDFALLEKEALTLHLFEIQAIYGFVPDGGLCSCADGGWPSSSVGPESRGTG